MTIVPPDLPVCFTRLQARAFGLSDRQLATLVKAGELDRASRGHYRRRVEAAWEFEERRRAHLAEAEATLLSHGAGFALAELTAAMAQQLPVPLSPLGPVHLCADTAFQGSRRRRDFVIHHGDSVTMVASQASGMPCTPLTRTVADCLRGQGAAVAVPIADAALRSGECTVRDIVAQLKAQSHWPGKRRAVQSLAMVDGRRESWLESRAAVSMARSALDLPEAQVVVLSASGRFIGRVDGLWPADNTALEVDGKLKYELPDAWGVIDPEARLAEQEERQQRLEDAGLEVVRADSELVLDPDRLYREIQRGRRRGRRRTFTGTLIVPDSSLLRLPTD
jgi:hypothetical protein